MLRFRLFALGALIGSLCVFQAAAQERSITVASTTSPNNPAQVLCVTYSMGDRKKGEKGHYRGHL
jgi:hypothetical protein